MSMFQPATREQMRARIALAGPAGSGKAQPVDAPVLTPTGWRRIGDIRVGDEIFSADGTPTHVVGVYPQGVQPIYRLTFSDGATAESTSDHLWFTQTVLDRNATTKVAGRKVSAPRAGSPKILSEIMTSLRDRDGKRNHWIPMCAAVDFPESPADLPLDGWLLGVILGDGGLTGGGVVVSKPGDELRREVSRRLPDGARIGWDNGLTFGITGTTHGRNPVLDMLRDLNLHGLKSTEKHIPHAYRFASAKTRAAVLAGLLDTDGYADGYTCEFSTSSARLAEDVQFLVESLGGTATVSRRESSYRTPDGQRHTASESWRIAVCPPAGVNPFLLRADRFTPRTRYPARRAIDSVTYTRDAEAVCIAIAHPSRLYITSHFAVTHNTYTALTLATVLSTTGRIAMVDTELRGNEYADRFTFNRVAVPVADPRQFSKLTTAAAAEGHDVLIVDSFTHYWSGNGGALDLVDRNRDKRAGWSEYRPVENDMMAALLTFPGHVIVTLRVKTNYVTEESENGRQRVRKLGLKPDQRDSIDYEFSIIGEMDMSHTLTVTKTTCPDLVDATIPRPGQEFGETLLAWLGRGEALPTVLDYRERILAAAGDDAALRALWEETGRRALRDAPVRNAADEVTNLGELIRACKATTVPTAATALADAAASNGANR